MNTTTMHHSPGYTLTSRVSWSAILAGVVIGLILEALLNLLGLGLGFTAFSADSDTIAKIGTGSMIWFAISGLIALLGGGWIAGWFANTSCRFTGALHGLITWGLATLLTFILMASVAGALIGGTASLVGQGLSLAGKGAASAGKGAMQLAPQVAETAKNTLPEVNPALNKVMQQAEQIVARLQSNPSQEQQTSVTTQSPEQVRKQLQQAVTALFSAESENDKASARQQVVNFLSQNANMSSTQAEQTVNDWQQSYEQMKAQLRQKAAQAKEQAKAASEKAADIASSIALTTFFILLLSAMAAAFGGLIGTRTGAKNVGSLPVQE
jgi:hypothetical protein